jgi:hypothetical protein
LWCPHGNAIPAKGTNSGLNNKKLPISQELMSCAPTEIRTPVLALKGLRPSPLDDGGKLGDFTIAVSKGQGL